jgi:hypothetical protein
MKTPPKTPFARWWFRNGDTLIEQTLGWMALPLLVALVMGFWPVLLIGLAVFALLVVIGRG